MSFWWRDDGEKARLSRLPVPLTTYQLTFPSLMCSNSFMFPAPGPVSWGAALVGGPARTCHGAAEEWGGLRGLFVPLLALELRVTSLCLGQLSWGKLGSGLHYPQQPPSSAPGVY